jgi:F-type H+-transporting ATPase subunit gamma
MKNYQRQANASRDFSEELLRQIALCANESSSNMFTENRTEGKKLFVVMTSDKGLCGNLNQRIIKKVFSSEIWQNTKEEDRMLITIGKKSADAARRMGINIHKSFVGIGETITPLTALSIINNIIAPWEDKTCKEIYLVYPQYKNAFLNIPVIAKYLPYSEQRFQEYQEEMHQKEKNDLPTIFEPDFEHIQEKLWLQFIQMLFTAGFYEMKASEYSNRMIAMKKATDAAEEMIGDLTLEMNKARQAQITQELSELAGASMANID